MSWCLPRLYKNISHRDYLCFSFAGCLANNQFSVCRTCTKYICETYLWLPGVQSTAEPHTDNTLHNTPANVCRKLESKFLSLCYVQLEGRVMLPQSEPWSAICLFPSSFQLSKRGSPSRYLRLELLLLPGGERGAAVRRHFHLRDDFLDLTPHAVTFLCAEKLLQDKEAILMELEETGWLLVPRVLGGSSTKQEKTLYSVKSIPAPAPQPGSTFLIFNFRRGFCCKRFIKRLKCQAVKNNLFQPPQSTKQRSHHQSLFVVQRYLI